MYQNKDLHYRLADNLDLVVSETTCMIFSSSNVSYFLKQI